MLNISNYILVKKDCLGQDGFTNSGEKQFIKTIEDFTSQLFTKSVFYADSVKDVNSTREVTHEQVKQASEIITRSFNKNQKTKLQIIGQISEYILTGIAGIGGGNLDKQWGILALVISMALAVILISYRLSTSNKE
ncbi:hypothetical protein K2X92_03835 [Candidatus Gracilibacteria bacterium]|nr:hypothetical protein [Candidatus Gracilibacteria bacterium]